MNGRDSKKTVRISVNSVWHDLAIDRHDTLLDVLRGPLRLNGAKYGCGLGECGACTTLVDDRAVRACSIRAHQLSGHAVTTLEGLATNGLDPVQMAFVSAQAAQCGYCLNGMVMTIRALLNANPNPNAAEIRSALRYNLCRCGTHIEIMQAACLAAGLSKNVDSEGT